MIKNKEIETFQLPNFNPGLLSNQIKFLIPNIVKKYYEDLDYINNMKPGKEYHKLHL